MRYCCILLTVVPAPTFTRHVDLLHEESPPISRNLSLKMLHARIEAIDAPDSTDEITPILPQQMLYDALGELIPDLALT